MKKDELFQIGELAKICEMSVQALRHYDKVGLLSPIYIDPETSYRYYSKSQLFELTIIRQFKLLGWSLDEIKDFLSKKDFAEIRPIYLKKKSDLDRQISKLNKEKERIEVFLNMSGDYLADLEKIQLREIPLRHVVFVRKKRNNNFYEALIHFTNIQNLLIRNKIHSVPPFIGIFYDGYESNGNAVIDVAICHSLKEKPGINADYFLTIPGGKYVVAKVAGDFQSSMKTYCKMKEFILQKGYKENGKTLSVYILPIAIGKSPESVVREIQIPVI